MVAYDPGALYSKEFGLPGMLLPDSVKDLKAHPVLTAMWEEFDSAVAAASAVVVIGHSLEDDHLIEHLKPKVDGGRAVVGAWLHSANKPDLIRPADREHAENERQRLNLATPGAVVLPLEFAPDWTPPVDLLTRLKSMV